MWNQWQTWVIILVVVLLLFGATRLPALARSLGQSMRVFRSELKNGEADANSTESTSAESDQSADKK
ncbi:MAG: twin-arginine translocase TatA/TatE family subunit [Actinomycetales bacterium]|nr:twin-arginine translocase TatA/TatE family subunit [Actinomycetales bacterium]